MKLERRRHRLGVGLPETRRALDVGEHEGHDPGGQLCRRRLVRAVGFGSGHRHRKVGILRQDAALQLAQTFARLDPQLLDESSPGVLVCLQGIGLPVRAVEREHQLRPEALSIGVLVDERL